MILRPSASKMFIILEVALLCLCWPLYEAITTQMEALGSTVADFHENVTLSCALSDPKGVKQVMWHRRWTNGSMETIAAHGVHLEGTVSEPFAHKVLLTVASLNSTAITVRGVSLEDEGCYICSFNIYPKGTTRKQSCLIVRGIRTVRTSKRPLVAPALDTEKAVVVTCSATGKPAPKVQWRVSEDPKSGPMETTSSSTNSDGTITVTSSLTLDLSASPRTHVDCLVGSEETQKRIVRRIRLQEDQLPSSADHSSVHPKIMIVAHLFVAFFALQV